MFADQTVTVETSHEGNWIAWGSTAGVNIDGTDGNDLIDSGGGDDTIDGGAGDDTLLLFANRSTFDITVNGDTITLTGNSSSGLAYAYWLDTITMTNVETIMFADQTVLVSELTSSNGSIEAISDIGDDDANNLSSPGDNNFYAANHEGYCQLSEGDLGCRVFEDDLPKLWDESFGFSDIVLPDFIPIKLEFENDIDTTANDLELSDLVIEDLIVDEIMISDIYHLGGDDISPIDSNNFKPDDSDPINELDYFYNFDQYGFQEGLIYISELG